MPLDPQKTAAPHEEEEQSPGREAMRIDNLKTMQPQALAEMQVRSYIRLPAGGRTETQSWCTDDRS
jgi:hypothetical protein